jgi:protein involved in polysaccharide export with SLBB domain
MKLLRLTGGNGIGILTCLAALLLSGCASDGPSFIDPSQIQSMQASAVNGFRPGDTVTVIFSGNSLLPTGPQVDRVKEDGTITLPYIGAVKAVGKTPAQLQKDLYQLYVPRIFTAADIVVNGQEFVYYIDGEIRAPGPRNYPGDMTIVKAIAAGGGFTDFAKKTKVRLTRANGHTELINVEKAITNPQYDVPVYPGDSIHVGRRILW